MTNYPAPAPPYAGPPHRSSAGNNKPIVRIVWHSTVSPCEAGGARTIARYFRSAAAGGSAHYVVDPAETIQAAWDSVICWHAPPNQHSLGIEMCEYPSSWNLARWLDKNHRAMRRRTELLTAQLCLAYGIAPYWLGVRACRAGKKGVTSHATVSRAFGQSTHWDPGAFPRRLMMRRVRKHVARIKKEAAK